MAADRLLQREGQRHRLARRARIVAALGPQRRGRLRDRRILRAAVVKQVIDHEIGLNLPAVLETPRGVHRCGHDGVVLGRVDRHVGVDVAIIDRLQRIRRIGDGVGAREPMTCLPRYRTPVPNRRPLRIVR
jgi:hypothetical protein